MTRSYYSIPNRAILAGKASDFQAHSAKFTQSLSVVYLGREAIKKQLAVSHMQIINAINKLTAMAIEAQLEKHIYDSSLAIFS